MGPDIPFNGPGSAPADDPVLRCLVGLRLVEHERAFRAVLVSLKAGSRPTTRQLVVATMIVLMALGGMDHATLGIVQAKLQDLPDGVLNEAAVAVVNGGYLLLPTENSTDWYNLQTLQPVLETERPPALVSTVYSTATIWEKVVQLVG